MKKIALFTLIVLLLPSMSGCSLFAAPSPTPTFPPTSTATMMLPSPTEMPPTQALPTATPTATPMVLPTPITPLTAQAWVDNIVLRSGPGKLFENLKLYKENTTFTVLGMAPGGQWYFVVGPDNLAGWMSMQFLTLQGNAADLPYLAVPNADVIKGHVTADDGTPATRIGVSISPVGMDLPAGPDATETDSTGTFYLYVPKGTSGEYNVGPSGYSPESNLVVGKDNLPYTFPNPIQVNLPLDASINLEFVFIHT